MAESWVLEKKGEGRWFHGGFKKRNFFLCGGELTWHDPDTGEFKGSVRAEDITGIERPSPETLYVKHNSGRKYELRGPQYELSSFASALDEVRHPQEAHQGSPHSTASRKRAPSGVCLQPPSAEGTPRSAPHDTWTQITLDGDVLVPPAPQERDIIADIRAVESYTPAQVLEQFVKLQGVLGLPSITKNYDLEKKHGILVQAAKQGTVLPLEEDPPADPDPVAEKATEPPSMGGTDVAQEGHPVPDVGMMAEPFDGACGEALDRCSWGSHAESVDSHPTQRFMTANAQSDTALSDLEQQVWKLKAAMEAGSGHEDDAKRKA